MLILRLLLLFLGVVIVMLVIAGQSGLLAGKQPSNLGLLEGKLKPPSKTENSVSSQASLHPNHPMLAYADIAPIAFTGDAANAWGKLERSVAGLERTKIITNKKLDSGERYLYAQSTTLLLRFTDDVEFVMDEANKVIHVRSSSRLGRKDFGVNRKRIEAVRAAFNAS